MVDENLLVTLEASLRQTRATRARRASRLTEVEMEAEKLRAEITEMDTFAAQTEAAMFRILTSVINPGMRSSQPSDADIEAVLQQDSARASFASMITNQPYGNNPNNTPNNIRTFQERNPNERYAPSPPTEQERNYQERSYQNNTNERPAQQVVERHAPTNDTAHEREYQPLAAPPPPIRSDLEPTSERFLDRTIPQATALLLKESSIPLHVNEIYNRLLEGGFQFSGNNPTISIAVSLNRNRRFRKVAPGTFELNIRDVAQPTIKQQAM